MDVDTAKPKMSPARNAVSILLFVVAGALLAVAAYLFIQERRNDDAPPPPPSIAGQAQLANVRDILIAAGLDVEYGRESARVEDLSPAGQQLIVDGQSTFVFIYNSPEDRQSETEHLNLDEIELVDPVTTDLLSFAEGSNVVTIIAGADDELSAAVADAIATLP